MWSLVKDIQGRIFAGSSGTIKGVFRTSNGGDTWDTAFIGGASNILYLACDSSNRVYATYGANGLLKSTNSGNNWITIPDSVFGNKTVQAVACGKNGYVYVGTVSGYLSRSTDNGLTFPDTALSGLTIVTITIDRFNPNIVYVGASSTSPSNTGFYRSTDAGLTFSQNLNPLNIWAIVEKNNHNLYTVTTSTGYAFSKSTDGGLTWTTVSSLSGAMRGACLDLLENIYTSGNGGVFKSTNDGVSFTNAGLTISADQSLSYQNRILVATSGTSNGGVWIYVDSTISGITNSNTASPDKFLLFQNYPNPFNPGTNIRYQIINNSYITLKIFDILGKEIAALVNEKQNAGIYNIEWDAENYSSGIYFYKLTADGFTDIKKMVLLK